MVCFKSFWHGKWAGATGALLAILTLACGGSKDSSNITVKGNVAYTRPPLVKNASGVPTGLSESYGTAQAARGVLVRTIKAVDEKLSNGSITTVYHIADTTYTDGYGNYSLKAPKNVPCFVEVLSVAGDGVTHPIRIVSDTADDIQATESVDCTLYSLRKALNATPDEGNPVYATQSSGNVTVNFAADSSTKWWLAAAPTELVSDASLEPTATGSRILGIIDSIYTFTYVYGDPTPGGTLDLFYRPTKPDDSRGSFVDYSDASRYYGSLRANGNDDAWDESILFMLCARNALYSHLAVTPYTPPSDQLPLDDITSAPTFPGLARKTGLDPVHALIDGMPYGMAASLLKSPYLADTTGTTTASVRDIRTLGDLEKDAYSAPGIAALSWNLLIRANGLTDTYSAWASINTQSLRRFFTLIIPADSSSRPSDIASVYTQLLRLQEGKASEDPIDLGSIFTDSVLSTMVAPYSLGWPRPAGEASYLLDWGTDPNRDASNPITFSMDMASAGTSAPFSNLSKGEIVHAKFLLSKDILYRLSVAVSPALPDNAEIEIKVLDASGQYQTLDVTGAGGEVTDSLMLDGNSTTSNYTPIHFRLKPKAGMAITTVIAPVSLSITLVPRAS